MNKQLVAWLTDNAGVANRVFPLVLPSNVEKPAITYQRVSGPLTTGQNFADGFGRSIVQVDVYAKTYAMAQSIKSNIVLGLNGYQGGKLLRVSVDNIRDEYEQESKLFRQIIDLEILAYEE